MPPGRPKGSLNVRTLQVREEFERACKKHGGDFIGSWLELCYHEDPSIAIQARKGLAPYVMPALKAQEMTVVDPVRIVLVDHTREPEDPLS